MTKVSDAPLGRRVTNESITLVYQDGKPLTVNKNHPHFAEITRRVQEQEYEGLRELCQPAAAIAAKNLSGVEIKFGEAWFNGIRLEGALSKRMVEEFEAGRDISQYSNFVRKVYENPSSTAVKELFLFMEAGYMPLCEDGDFLAYKKVRGDFRDIHSGTMDNSPGNLVTMPRNQVDDRRDNTCSYGLHFCSYTYLPQFGSCSDNKVVMLKINPANVVSIPSDYQNTKGRACEYFVVQEVEGWEDDPLMGTHGNDWGIGRNSRDDLREDEDDYEDDYEEEEEYDYEDGDDDDWDEDDDDGCGNCHCGCDD
jgi:hypothetical protein